MERIGIAASKMAQGNIILYNLYVILISFIFSLFIFFLSGASILFGLIIIGYIVNGVLPANLEGQWGDLVRICMISLTVVIILLNIFAILKNIRLKRADNNHGNPG